MTDRIVLDVLLPVPPERVYRAWLSSSEHTEMTGGEAVIDPRVGGAFSAWDGYIEGTTLDLDPARRVLQSWRTLEFAADDDDSLVEVVFAREGTGTRLWLHHTHLPSGAGRKYTSGWRESYFEPMLVHFLSS